MDGDADWAILGCGTGIGMAIAANRVRDWFGLELDPASHPAANIAEIQTYERRHG